MSVKSSLNSNFPTEDSLIVQFPSVKLIVTSSFSIDVLVCECRVSPEQPRSESVITKRFGGDARRLIGIGEGRRVMVSIALERPAGSATRGAAADRGTTTPIDHHQRGTPPHDHRE